MSLQFRQSLLQEFQASRSAGYSSVKATTTRLAASFYWPTLYKDTRTFICSCMVCQQNKPVNKKQKGLLQPFSILAKIWTYLTMDFIIHLPSSFGHIVIWVICGHLTKFVHFIAYPHTTPCILMLTIFLLIFAGYIEYPGP